MGLTRESLPVLLDRMYAAYMSRFKPLDQTARYNLIKVLSEVQAGMYHQLLGDLSFWLINCFRIRQPGIICECTGLTVSRLFMPFQLLVKLKLKGL